MRSQQFHSDRVEALRRSGLLVRSQREEFGHLTEHVRDVLDVPVSIVTLVDEDRQVFAGHSGLPSPWDERGETPMTHSFCQHVVDRNAPLVTSDARQDPLLHDNLAIGDIGVVAYLGVPLALPDGEVVGALAAIDTQPREWTAADERRLRSIARTVEKEMAVRISESRWRSLFEGLHEGFILGRVVRDDCDLIVDWRYEEVNDAWHDLVGVPRGTVVGRTIREVFPGIEDAWVDEFAEVVRTGEPVRFTRQVGTLGRWYDGVAQSIGGDRFTVIFLEVTDRVARERRREALHELGQVLFAASDPDAMLHAGAAVVGRALGVGRVGYGQVGDDGEAFTVPADWTADGYPTLAGHYRMDDYGLYAEDLRRGRTVVIPDIRLDPRTRVDTGPLERVSVRTLVNHPIVENGRTVAVFFVNDDEPRNWTRDEIAFVQDAANRMRDAVERRRAEEGQRVLNQELAHRMKNSLAMVQAIATQTLRQARTMDEGREAISTRLSALARAQDILTRTNFTEADVHEVVGAALAAHRSPQVTVETTAPHLGLTAQQALGLSLAVHELATNAAKYGALSTEAGHVAISWGHEDGAFRFRWIETGGPPVTAPERRGFGSKLIERIVAAYFDGEGRIDFDPAGIRFTLTGARTAHPQTSQA